MTKIQQWELSSEADQDLQNIFDYTFEEFGVEQAYEYVYSFDDMFELLRENPELGRSRFEIRNGLRSFSKDHHVIFYRIIKNKIRIVRVLHTSMDFPVHFKD